jgi:hypothetical protein
MDFMGSKRDELGICFGGCTSNRQCYDIWGGNHKCLAPVRLPTNEVSTKVAFSTKFHKISKFWFNS